MRVKMLALLATAIVVGVSVLPSLASAAPEAEAGVQNLPSAQQARVMSECPASYVCFWSGKSFGQAECQAGLNCFSAFHGYEVGYHALENINPQSVYNHTGEHWAIFYTGPFGEVELGVGPGHTEQFGGRWNSGFEMR